jgi:menaquinone-dependent protoporphyrinogen oxidase
MRVLVSAASKHGATTEMAATIGATLESAGFEVVVAVPAEVTDVSEFDAAVIGSGVYAGRWLAPARDLLRRHRDALALIPVWLFSSGPVGEPLAPAEDPVDAAAMVALIGARGHRVFAGQLDRARLGVAERAIVAVVHAHDGDFRPWPEIKAWGRTIARELGAAPVP